MGLGKEVIFPIKFNGYELPGLDIEIEIPEGCEVQDVFEEMNIMLRGLRERQADAAFEDWAEHLMDAKQRLKDLEEEG